MDTEHTKTGRDKQTEHFIVLWIIFLSPFILYRFDKRFYLTLKNKSFHLKFS